LHRPISKKVLTEESRCRIRALNDIAQRRGQALAQRGLAWCLRVICG
jgi:aryl-alcohol dehydrogenase-like predicted oxidoreductase